MDRDFKLFSLLYKNQQFYSSRLLIRKFLFLPGDILIRMVFLAHFYQMMNLIKESNKGSDELLSKIKTNKGCFHEMV